MTPLDMSTSPVPMILDLTAVPDPEITLVDEFSVKKKRLFRCYWKIIKANC